MTEAPGEGFRKSVDATQTVPDEKEVEEFLAKSSGIGRTEEAQEQSGKLSPANVSLQDQQGYTDTGEDREKTSSSVKEQNGINDTAKIFPMSSGLEGFEDASAAENEFLESLGEPIGEDPGDARHAVRETPVSVPFNLDESKEKDLKNDDKDEAISESTTGSDESDIPSSLGKKDEADRPLADQLVNVSGRAEGQGDPKDLAQEGARELDNRKPENLEQSKKSSGILESVGDSVVSLSSSVLASAKGIVGLRTNLGKDTVRQQDSSSPAHAEEIATDGFGSEPIASVEPSACEMAGGQESDKAYSLSAQEENPEIINGTPIHEPTANVEETALESSEGENSDQIKTDEDQVLAEGETGDIDNSKFKDLEESKQSPGILESERDNVESLSSSVFASAKGAVGVGTPGANTGMDTLAQKDTDNKNSLEDEKNPDSTTLSGSVLDSAEGLVDVGKPGADTEADRLVQEDSYDQQSVEDEKSPGILESVGNNITSKSSSVLASAKGIIGLGTSGANTDSDSVAQQDLDNQESAADEKSPGVLQSVGDNFVSKSSSVLASAKGMVSPGTPGTKTDTDTGAQQDSDNQELVEDEKGPGILESAGDNTVSLSSSVLSSVKGMVGLGTPGANTETDTVIQQESDNQEPVQDEKSPGVLESVGDSVVSSSSSVLANAKGTVGPGTPGASTEMDTVAQQDSDNQESAEDEKSAGVLKSVGDNVVSLSNSVVSSSKGLVGLGTPGTNSETDCVTQQDSDDQKPVEDEKKTESKSLSSSELGSGDGMVGLGRLGNLEESVETEEPRQSPGIVEYVGDNVVNLTSSVLATAKGMVGIRTPEANTETDSVAQQDLENRKPVEDEKNTESKSLSSSVLDSTKRMVGLGTTGDLEESVEREEPKQSPGIVEPVGDNVVSLSSSVVSGAKGIIGLGTPGSNAATSSEVSEPFESSVSKVANEAQQLQNGQDLHCSNGVTADVTEQPGVVDPQKETAFNAELPAREVERRAVEGSVSTPATPSTPGGSPLIHRVEQLEKKLAQFEDKQNSPNSQKCSAPSTPRTAFDRHSRPARHTLEETLSKGSLLDRVAALERTLNHVLLSTGDSDGQEVSSSIPVPPTATGEAPEVSESGVSLVTEDEVKTNLKPLKLHFGEKTPVLPNTEVESKGSEESIESKSGKGVEAVEDLVEPTSKADSEPVEKVAQSDSAEIPISPLEITNPSGYSVESKSGEAVEDVVQPTSKANSEPLEKVAQSESAEVPDSPSEVTNSTEESVESKSGEREEAVEDLVEPTFKADSESVEKVVQSESADVPNSPLELTNPTVNVKEGEDDATLNSEQNSKVLQDSVKGISDENLKTTTTEVKTPETVKTPQVKKSQEVPVSAQPQEAPGAGQAQPRELPASKHSQVSKGKSGSPVSKLKALLKGCFPKGGKKKSTAV